jgi:PhoH-like ATPase
MAKSKKTEKKIFVLDTSVILYDHNAVKNFQEHDVAIPITVLEELDNFKKGNDTKNFEAREFIRFIDKISGENKLQDWIPLEGTAKGKFKVQMNTRSELDAEVVFDERKADHRILNAALALQEEYPDSKIIMVTKDINLRLKAKALNLPAEDYETGKIKNVDSLYTGKTVLSDIPSEVITKLHEEGVCDLADVIKKGKPRKNHFYILKSERNSVLACYNPLEDTIEKVEKREVYGIRPRNAEQTFAIDAILNRDIKLLTIQGVAGTGKTLLALASALEMRKHYRQIFLARPIVPLSNKDIGYLPGDVKSKLNPYMEPLWDNLKFIQSQFEEGDRYWNQIQEMLMKETLQIMPLAYIRGRSLSNVIFIVDEAQNLTPHEVKTIITRAGENTKIVFTGDVYQIDTPYLDTQSNGLSYLIDRVKDHKLYAHITLERGERSELANLANELL